jgi:hypothetical protein
MQQNQTRYFLFSPLIRKDFNFFPIVISTLYPFFFQKPIPMPAMTKKVASLNARGPTIIKNPPKAGVEIS